MINIDSQKIRIQQIILSDINEEYIETLNNQEYMKFSRNSNMIHTIESQKKYIESFNSFNKLLLSIKDTKTDALIGTITVFIDYRKHDINIGFLIFPSNAGKNYATLSLKLLVEFFEYNFPNYSINMGTRSSNIAMKKVAIKNGFEHNSQYGQIDSEIIQYKKLIPIVSQNTESKIPSLIFGTRVIGIVANDSGGANQIYYLIKQIKKPVLAYLKGPASNIFKNGNIQYTPIKKFSDLKKCDLVVTGSGWMTDLEFNAIKFCEESNIPSLTVLDHWVNFKSRFSRKFEIVPNMLAVTNKIAFKFAEQDFQDIPIWLIPDFQLESYRLRLTNKPSGDKVLVLLEPNSGLSNDFYITRHMEFEIINKAIFFNNKEGCDGVIIRPHPSKNGFDSRLKNFITNFNDISISSNNKLEDDLVDAKLVLGFNSYGLYLSSMSGIKTYSYFANSFGHWTNSYPEILPIFNNSKFKN